MAAKPKLSKGELFQLVQDLQGRCGEPNPLPENPKKFPGVEEATEAMEEAQIKGHLEDLGVAPSLVLGMAGVDEGHESLVLLAHLAIMAACSTEEPEPRPGSSKDTEESGKGPEEPKAKKARTEVFGYFFYSNQSVINVLSSE